MSRPAIQEQIVPEPSLPQPAAYVGSALVGLNTRVDQKISAALLRASMERRLQRQEKSKLQDIVGEALADWLRKNGHLN